MERLFQVLLGRLWGGGWRRLACWGLGIGFLIWAACFARQAIWVDAHAPARLIVYAFSTQEEVLTQGIFPAFKQLWEAETGHDLNVEGVFGPSGQLAGEINLGAPADVALFSNAQHVNWLKVGRRVHAGTEPIVFAYTPMVIVTRPGNPAGIADYADLARPGLRLLHANPRSSGAGEWAVLAEYGSVLLAGAQDSSSVESGDRVGATAQLAAIWRNVRLLAPSARAALDLFELGAGDALVTYEQDARLARERGAAMEIILPPRTIVAHHVAVAVDDNVTAPERRVVQSFLSFLVSDAGQRILSRYHLRTVTFESEAFPRLVEPFTVGDLGGWSRIYRELVEDLWQGEIEPHLNLEPVSVMLETGK